MAMGNRPQRRLLRKSWGGGTTELTSNTDVTRLAAGIFLSVGRRRAHELVACDFRNGAEGEIHRVSVNHFQDYILRVVVDHRPVFFSAGQEFVILQVQLREALLTELVSRRAGGREDKDDIVVGRVHAVEVPKVQVSIWVEKFFRRYLKPVSSVGRILRGLPSVEFSVAAKEDALQLPADGRAVAPAVILDRRLQSAPVLLSRNEGRVMVYIYRGISERDVRNLKKLPWVKEVALNLTPSPSSLVVVALQGFRPGTFRLFERNKQPR